jgi:hypothetical protein
MNAGPSRIGRNPSGRGKSCFSWVWRLKDGYIADFMALLIRTDYFLSLVAFNRVGAVKQRMY